jgi:hypothetical protein
VAPVLQCPDCGQKHPLDAVSNTPAFRCKGCGRMLKLPSELLPSAPDEPAAAPTVFPPRRVPPAMRGSRRLRGDELPRVARVAIWFVAVPLSFVLVFGTTRAFGFLSQRQLEDTFLLSGWDRFWPILRVLPFWALITALVVHFGNIGVVQWQRARQRRKTQPKVSRSRRPINGRPPRGSAVPRTSATGETPTRKSRVS